MPVNAQGVCAYDEMRIAGLHGSGLLKVHGSALHQAEFM